MQYWMIWVTYPLLSFPYTFGENDSQTCEMFGCSKDMNVQDVSSVHDQFMQIASCVSQMSFLQIVNRSELT